MPPAIEASLTAVRRFFDGPARQLWADRRARYAAAGILLAIPLYFFLHLWILVGQTLNHGLFASTSNIYASPDMVTKGDALTPDQLIAALSASGYNEESGNAVGYFRQVDSTSVEIHPGPESYFRAEPAALRFTGSAASETKPKPRSGKSRKVKTNDESKPSESAAPAKLRAAHLAEIRMLDKNSETVNEYLLEPRLIANLGGDAREKRRLVTFHEIPPVLINAVLSAEDKRFFSHWGFDPLRLGKAIYVDLRSGRKEQGGSTLTMQLARMLWLDQSKNWGRKATELVITLMLEVRLSKQEIFEHYANEVYLGEYNTFGIHGFGEAARVYFNKRLENLTVGEAATLAGLIQRPSFFQPFLHPDRALARRNVILGLMQHNGFVKDTDLEKSQSEDLNLNPDPGGLGDAPYFVALAVDEAAQRLPVRDAKGPAVPRKIYTTVDSALQKMAVEAVQEGMPLVDRLLAAQFGAEAKKWGPPQVALVAIDPRTGEIKAAVGGRNYRSSQLNHVISKRQPGSVFKPFVYAAALNSSTRGRSGPITPASTLMDEPHKFWFHHESYEPGNFGDHFFGQVTLRMALAHSLNVATVALAEEVGYGNVAALAKNAGLNQSIQPTPSMALGSYETTPLEIAGAYTMFANGGVYTKPRFIASVRDARTGKPVLRDEPEQHRVLDERVNYLMVDMLQEVMNSGTAAGVRGMGFYAPAAGKTGTSRDGWFAGFTSELVTVVWVGFDDNRELNLEGARSALPVWTIFNKKVAGLARYAPRELATRPAGMVQVEVDPQTGLLVGPSCPYKQWSYFLQGQEPKEECMDPHDPDTDPFKKKDEDVPIAELDQIVDSAKTKPVAKNVAR